MRTVSVSETFVAPPAAVFDILADHGEYQAFDGIKRSRLLQEGTNDKNGDGAVREIIAGPGLRFVEAISEYDAPRRFVYKITDSTLPLVHDFGEVVITATEGGCRAEWRSTFTFGVPLIGGAIAAIAKLRIEAAFGGILREVKERVE